MRGEQGGLGGGGVLVFVQQHLAETPAIPFADRGETGDQLVGGYGEIAELGHIETPLGFDVILDEIEQQLTVFGDREQLRAIEYAQLMTASIPVEFGGKRGVGVLLRAAWGLADLGLALSDRVVAHGLAHAGHERRIPLAHARDGLVHVGDIAADHAAADRIA